MASVYRKWNNSLCGNVVSMCELGVAYSKSFIFQSILRGPLPDGENELGGRCFEQPCLPEKAAPALH